MNETRTTNEAPAVVGYHVSCHALVERALKWAAENGVKLSNIRDGRVWL
jgi:predicted type IV restriction endonuclease